MTKYVKHKIQLWGVLALAGVLFFQASVVSLEQAQAQRAKGGGELAHAMQLSRQGKNREASEVIFRLIQNPAYAGRQNQLRYLLGLMFFNMKMYQVAAFQFMSVVSSNRGKYVKQGLEKLSLAADYLGDDTLLNYAIAKIRVRDFPKQHADVLFYRLGEFQMRQKQFSGAVRSFNRVNTKSPLYGKSKYLQALAYVELRQNRNALRAFNVLLNSRVGFEVNDDIRVAAQLGIARLHYQSKQWAKASAMYHQVPRDSEFWHDTLLEISWALVRQGRFRRALGHFQTVHSPFYKEAFFPETLLVRAIIYLYICQFSEMQKVLDLFQGIYRPAYKKLSWYLKQTRKPEPYFDEVVKALKDYNDGSYIHKKDSYAVPFVLARHVFTKGAFRGSYDYIVKLIEEQNMVRAMPTRWQRSIVGRYAMQILNTRLKNARARAGRQARALMQAARTDMIAFFEQEGLIRYEMLNGRKSILRKRQGMGIPADAEPRRASRSRSFYVQNGFQLWDFKGEYWLDELGNYFYVGQQSCTK